VIGLNLLSSIIGGARTDWKRHRELAKEREEKEKEKERDKEKEKEKDAFPGEKLV
jgi:hypothetical protein